MIAHNVVDCFACGRAFLYKGPSGDDSGRFCHQRCREWFDAGNPAQAPVNVMSVPIRDWKVVAGPPGVKLGASYYGPILDRKRPLRHGLELIRPRRSLGEGQGGQKIGQILRRSTRYTPPPRLGGVLVV